METKDFKKSFTQLAKQNGFTYEFNALFKESDFALLAMILRKSNYSRLFYLRIKVALKNSMQETLQKYEWVKHDVADILLGVDKKFIEVFDLENQIRDKERLNLLEDLFNSNLNALTKKALDREGIIELFNEGTIILLPSVKLKLSIS